MKINPGKVIKSKPIIIKEGLGVSPLAIIVVVLALLMAGSCSINEPIENIQEPADDFFALDEVDSIVWWEIQDDSLIIWTEEDERKADLERFRYIDSIYKSDLETLK